MVMAPLRFLSLLRSNSMDNPRGASQLSAGESVSPTHEAASSRDCFAHRPPPVLLPSTGESSLKPRSRKSCPDDSPVFRRLPSVCDQHLMTESMLETSTSTGDRHWKRDSRSSSQEPSNDEGGYDFGHRQSSAFSRLSSEGSTTFPEWPELDPVAFMRGQALLGSMELDPSCFSRDDLCHLLLEIFRAAGSTLNPKP